MDVSKMFLTVIKDPLPKAYRILFGQYPYPTMEEWEIAADILNNWNVPALGEELAEWCTSRIIVWTEFPSEILTRKYVGIAEDKHYEFSERDCDVHCADVERISREVEYRVY